MKNNIIPIAVISLLLTLSIACKTDKKPAKETDKADTVQSAQKPNIVLLFVDDWGWVDLGYRTALFHTPNIDQLKKDGLEFTRAYIATPTCSPSRASLLTGKEPVRFQMVRHIPGGNEAGFKNGRTDEEFHLWPTDPVQMPSRNWFPLEEVTYAERLKEYGYYNMFIGKWHLGHEPYHPIHQGFDEQYGTANAGHPHSYYPPYFKIDNPLEDIPKDKYLTDVLTDKAEDFIGNYNKTQPFMLSLWYYNVHGPHEGPKDLVEKYKEEGLEDRFANYAAMVTAMDESVGRIRKALEDNGMDENTVLLLISDQGGYFDQAPLSGGKTGGNTLGEGGARVPFIVDYPGLTKANTTTDIPVQSLDIYPTLIEIASGQPCTDDWINGKSLMPIIKGDSLEKRNLYFFRSYEDQYASVISGDWKLVKYHSGKYELFNVALDISEKNNLIEVETQQAEKMKNELIEWEKKAVPEFQKGAWN